jgi:16S rRNA (uracil1498-N3)-methyltransferase
MTRRRWIADEVTGDTAALLGEHALHLSRVLRARVGQQFDIAIGSDGKSCGNSEVRRGTITAISADRVEFALGDQLDNSSSPISQITLALAIFKFDRMEWAIEKCTEIGVVRIIPVIARRSDSHLVAASLKRHDRWQRIVGQAAEQSRRSAPPEITSPVKLKDLPTALPASTATRIVLAESLADANAEDEDEDEEARLSDVLQSRPTEIALAIGPEGGWADDELTWFREAGWIAASLGPTILRAETAAIVATALAMNALR